MHCASFVILNCTQQMHNYNSIYHNSLSVQCTLHIYIAQTDCCDMYCYGMI